ncbi:hypothetical protein GGI12_004626 [Dipsacomyces acuminosporus]|nr:hypothetical protein GGI12_004626 [Dipsacomyces acuminosporus]
MVAVSASPVPAKGKSGSRGGKNLGRKINNGINTANRGLDLIGKATDIWNSFKGGNNNNDQGSSDGNYSQYQRRSLPHASPNGQKSKSTTKATGPRSGKKSPQGVVINPEPKNPKDRYQSPPFVPEQRDPNLEKFPTVVSPRIGIQVPSNPRDRYLSPPFVNPVYI